MRLMKAKSPVFLFPDMKTTKRMGYTTYGGNKCHCASHLISVMFLRCGHLCSLSLYRCLKFYDLYTETLWIMSYFLMRSNPK